MTGSSSAQAEDGARLKGLKAIFPSPRAFRGYLGYLRGDFTVQPLAYLETVGGLFFIVALNLLFFRDNWGFFDTNPHPFWLVIIPIAARYGAMPGYTAGMLAALLYLAFVLFQTRSVFAMDLLSTQAMLPPVLFLLTGGALGELREAHKRAQRKLAARYEEVETGLQDIAQRYLAAVEINKELERRIASQTSTVTTLYQAARGLQHLDIQKLCPSVLELVVSFVEAEACALYLRRDGRFVLAAGWPADVQPARPPELDTTRGIAAMVLSRGRTATIRDVIAEATPAQVAAQRLLMATPLFGQSQEVIGMITVEKLPFLRFTPTSVKLFALLGDWASGAFLTALRFQETRDRNVEDEHTGAYNYAYTSKRLREEFERARSYATPLGLLALRIDHFDAISSTKLPGVLRTVALVLRRHLQPFDILGKYASDDIFLVTLPHRRVEEALALGTRLRGEVEAFGFKPFDNDESLRVSVGVASLADGVGDAEQLLENALLSCAATATGRPVVDGQATARARIGPPRGDPLP